MNRCCRPKVARGLVGRCFRIHDEALSGGRPVTITLAGAATSMAAGTAGPLAAGRERPVGQRRLRSVRSEKRTFLIHDQVSCQFTMVLARGKPGDATLLWQFSRELALIVPGGVLSARPRPCIGQVVELVAVQRASPIRQGPEGEVDLSTTGSPQSGAGAVPIPERFLLRLART